MLSGAKERGLSSSFGKAAALRFWKPGKAGFVQKHRLVLLGKRHESALLNVFSSPDRKQFFHQLSFPPFLSGLVTVDPGFRHGVGLKSGGTVEAQPGHDQDNSGRRFQLKVPYHVEPD